MKVQHVNMWGQPDRFDREHTRAAKALGAHSAKTLQRINGDMSFPGKDVILSHILVVKDIHRSINWYRGCLGASLYREYGGTTAVFDLNGAWLILVTGGPPTPDKPRVAMEAISDPNMVSHSMTLRVNDCRAAYAELHGRGVEFLTEPVESEWEIRVFFRDPDGHLFELSEAKAK